MREPLSMRREMLRGQVLPKVKEPVRESPQLDASLPELLRAVKAHGFEGIVAKRLDSRYEPGQRSGAWRKIRINQGQEFVIGGYTSSPRNFDALIFGYYERGRLIYAARTRSGFTPASRAALYRRFRPLETNECPFANLPEARGGPSPKVRVASRLGRKPAPAKAQATRIAAASLFICFPFWSSAEPRYRAAVYHRRLSPKVRT